MTTLRALVLVPLLWSSRAEAQPLPAACAVVIPASASRRDAAERMRACNDALDARRARPVRTGRQFAALSELGELRIRRDAERPVFAESAPAPRAAEPAPEGCALAAPGSAAVASSACIGCHPRHGHPVGLDYGPAYARSRWNYRSPEEVVRRGVLLPEGRIECVTCHDGRSPWKHRIALPPGAPALPAVVAGRPETYSRVNWRTARASSVPQLPPGSAVTPSPLCATCHTLAD